MIKVTTSHGTVYIIDETNKQIKRIPLAGKTYDSVLRGFINVGEFQPYTEFDKDALKVGGSLQVSYPNEQNWSVSTPIIEIDYRFEEDESPDDYLNAGVEATNKFSGVQLVALVEKGEDD